MKAFTRLRVPLGTYTRTVELQSLSSDRGATGEVLKTYTTYTQARAAMSNLVAWQKGATTDTGNTATQLVRLQYNATLWGSIRMSDRLRLMDGDTERLLYVRSKENWNEANVEIRLQCQETLT
jgi:head-tail adaptor